jgi:VanZ family protein
MHNLIQARWLRWGLALGYSAFLIAYLLQQPGSPAVEIVAPVAAPDWKREVAFTIGHILGFGVLFLLWYAALKRDIPARAALTAFVIALAIGLLGEGLQSLLPDRNASLYDMTMNTVGMGLAWAVIRH